MFVRMKDGTNVNARNVETMAVTENETEFILSLTTCSGASFSYTYTGTEGKKEGKLKQQEIIVNARNY